jgi:alcohol dehydrogenase class IV
MKFEFATANQILFGAGVVSQVPRMVQPMGRRVFLVGGKTPQRYASLLEGLQAMGASCTTYAVAGEPTVPMAEAAVAEAREACCDVVIGIGGGSAIDLGKVVAALLTNDGDPMTYLEVVGAGCAIRNAPAPFIAIPTTAGTGAEVTRNAVLGVPEHRRKVSMRSPLMLPSVALIDPELTYSLSPRVTAQTGLDALTQVIEPYVSHLANPLTDGLCREGIRRAARSLRRAFEDGSDCAAREDMAIASLCGGLALANAKLGAVHGFAGPLGGEISAPHGAVCGRLLPFVVETNVQALGKRTPDHPARERFDELGPLLTGERKASAAHAVSWLHTLCRDLQTQALEDYGLTSEQVPEIVEQARSSSSMKGNPIELNRDELQWILDSARTR